MASQIDYPLSLPYTDVAETLTGLEWMRKIHNPNGYFAFMSKSKLDLDTDGINDPHITHWDADHQSTTNLAGLNSNVHPYIVLPGGFPNRHGGTHTIPLGCSCTVMYGEKRIHAIYGDVGPRKKYGEASIAVHRALGFERVSDTGHIINVGIDSGVYILVYLGCLVPNPLDVNNIQQVGHDNFVRFWQSA